MGLVGQRVDWELGKAVASCWDEVAGGIWFWLWSEMGWAGMWCFGVAMVGRVGRGRGG